VRSLETVNNTNNDETFSYD